MPDYDYECKACGHQFSVALSIHEHETDEHEKKKVQCPKCHSTELKHLVEPVFVTTSRKS